ATSCAWFTPVGLPPSRSTTRLTMVGSTKIDTRPATNSPNVTHGRSRVSRKLRTQVSRYTQLPTAAKTTTIARLAQVATTGSIPPVTANTTAPTKNEARYVMTKIARATRPPVRSGAADAAGATFASGASGASGGASGATGATRAASSRKSTTT